MQTIRIAACVVAASSCSAAGALTPTQVNDASTLQIYVASGESLQWQFGGGLLTLCEPGTASFYFYARSLSLASTSWEVLSDQERLQVTACRIRANPPGAFASLAGRNVALFVSTDSGLEATLDTTLLGPVAFPELRVVCFLAPAAATCANVTPPGIAPTYNCTGFRWVRPMAGVSEVDGNNIVGINRSIPSGQNFPMTQAHMQQRMFGIAASLPLYRVMQAGQGLVQDDQPGSRPGISSAMVRGFFSGSFAGGSRAWGHLVGGSHPDASSQVNICRSRNGSGVQAAFNQVFMQFPCGGAALSPADTSFSDQPDLGIEGIGKAGSIQVVDATVEREVEQCLDTASARGAFALGVVSIGRFPSNVADSGTSRLLRLDGASPTRDLAKVGRYAFFTQAFMRWNAGHLSTLAAPVQAFIRNYPALQRSAEVLYQGGSYRDGMMAPPTSAYGAGSVASRAMTSGVLADGCSPASFVATYPAAETTPAPASARASNPGDSPSLPPLWLPPRH